LHIFFKSLLVLKSFIISDKKSFTFS